MEAYTSTIPVSPEKRKYMQYCSCLQNLLIILQQTLCKAELIRNSNKKEKKMCVDNI